VFYVGVDPVDVGLVESFWKPGGRFTGIYSGFVDISAKRLEILKETALVIETARVKRLPLMLSDPDSVVKGGPAGYGVSYFAIGRLAARYVQRILLGAKPGDLPVEQADRPYFVINLKTAEALGLTIPPSVPGRANEMIQ
jgi:putative ABC transport system substrate-binding protein